MVTENYVTFETAKLLKEKGFDWKCHATYDTAVTGGKPKFSEYEVLNYFPYGMKNSDDKYSMVISAPTLQMAMKWLREVYHIFLSIQQHMDMSYVWYAYVDGAAKGCDRESHNNTYEDACGAAVKYCLENLI